MAVILVHSDRFAEHQTPPGHPERPERAEVMDAVAGRWRARGVEIVAPRAATKEQLARVHGPEYLRRISETAGRATALDRRHLYVARIARDRAARGGRRHRRRRARDGRVACRGRGAGAAAGPSRGT